MSIVNMRRFRYGILGALFLAVGVLVIIAIIIVARQSHFALFLLLPLPVLLVVIGFLVLKVFAYEVRCDDKGLKISFVFREKWINWDAVEWYKNVAWRGNFKGGANVWITLKYHDLRDRKKHKHKAVLLLPSIGSPSGVSSKIYATVLDQYIPDKKIGGRK